MLSFLLAVHFLLAILIIGLVLLQKHEADGVLGTGGSGGAGKMFSVRGQANLLTRSTAVLMTLFFINCLIMAKMVKHTPHKESIIDRVAKESVPVSTNQTNTSNNINNSTSNSSSSNNNVDNGSSSNVDNSNASGNANDINSNAAADNSMKSPITPAKSSDTAANNTNSTTEKTSMPKSANGAEKQPLSTPQPQKPSKTPLKGKSSKGK